jgi:15-cis-phytoene synthase
MITLFPLVLPYVPRAVRGDVAALFDLDAALGRIVASTTEPMIGQMRLTWWYERLLGLGDSAPPAEPVLVAVHAGSIAGGDLAVMVEGWEALLDAMPLDDVALRVFAEKRGERLFSILAGLCGGAAPVGLGAGWALVDFAMRCSDVVLASNALRMARTYLGATIISGPKSLRILAHVARTKAMEPPEHIRQSISRMMIFKAVLR